MLILELKDDAIANLNRVRPQREQENGNTTLEADAIEQAIKESKIQNQGSWKELFGKTYIKRTIVRALICYT